MFSNSAETDHAKTRYYRLNQLLLSAFSLWPFQKSKLTKISNIFHFTILGSFSFFQFTSFFTNQFTLDRCILVLSHAAASFLFIVQYYAFYNNPNEIKRFWNDIYDSWSLVKNEAERDILRQNSSSGEFLTVLMSLGMFLSLAAYAFSEAFPIILDLIFPLNETRPFEFHAAVEYFVDQKTYFYPIFCHYVLSLSFGCFVLIATGTFELIYMNNTCGLLRIASYRIKCSIENYASNNSTQKKDSVTHRNIIAAVDIHRRALERSEIFVNVFTPYWFILVIFGVLSASVSLLRLLRGLIHHNIYDIVAATIFVSFHFLIMYTGNYYGQKITDYNNEVFNSVYNVQWYKASLRIQKILLIIMQNTTVPYIINVGHLILASVEGFSKLMSTTMSYFMVIYTLYVP